MSDELDFAPNPMDALSSIQPIPTKKTLMLVNNFIVNTVDFINKFSALCERKLAKISIHTQKLETQLILLETKLESVPWTEADTQTMPSSSASVSNTGTSAVEGTLDTQPPPPTSARPPPPSAAEASLQIAVSAPLPAIAAPVVVAAPVAAGPKMKDDPRFEKYFRMLRAGIPKPVSIFPLSSLV